LPAPSRRGAEGPLARLSRIKSAYGEGAAAAKLACLDRLERTVLPRARDVLALHEALCWLRAYPDDAALLERVERMLDRFERRRDLRRHRRALRDSGIAGTEIRFRFFAPTAWRGDGPTGSPSTGPPSRTPHGWSRCCRSSRSTPRRRASTNTPTRCASGFAG
jgi:hypothetical protein